MRRFLQRFKQSERGAVTVDWVVITAGVVSLCIAVTALISSDAQALATSTSDFIRDRAE